MRQKIIIAVSLLLFFLVIYLITKDFFSNHAKNEENPTEYNLAKLRSIDSSQFCYKESRHFKLSMKGLNAIVIDSAYRIFIAGENEVQVLDSSLNKLLDFTTDSTADAIFFSNNKIYLAIQNHVEIYDMKGKRVQKRNPYLNSSFITSLVAENNRLYVADAANNVVLCYNEDGSLKSIIGKKDSLKGEQGFIIPSMYFDIALGQYNDLWIVNPGKHLLMNYNEKGDLRTSWGLASMQLEGFSGCCNPAQLAILPDGSFVTYEKGMERIKIYDQTGKYKCVVAGESDFNSKAINNFRLDAMVNDIATDLNGTVYVVDAVSDVVRMYVKK